MNPAAEANAVLRAQEYAARATVVRSRPALVTVETSAACNLRCVMCSRQGPDRGPEGMMTEAVFEKIKPLLSSTEHLQLHGLGEPTLSPVFWQLLKLIRHNGIGFSEVNTNGLLLNDDRIRELVDSGLSLINFSLDAATAETYRKIRGAKFEKVVANIRRLRQYRDECGRDRPQIAINMTMMVENIRELPAFVEMASDLGASAVYAGHLARGTQYGNDESWRVSRGDWTFVYTQQHLSNQPALANEMIRRAQQLAAEKGLSLVIGPEVFLPE